MIKIWTSMIFFFCDLAFYWKLIISENSHINYMLQEDSN